MWEDPIVADVHRNREKLAAEYGFDVKAIFADLRKRQAALGGRLVQQRICGSRAATREPALVRRQSCRVRANHHLADRRARSSLHDRHPIKNRRRSRVSPFPPSE